MCGSIFYESDVILRKCLTAAANFMSFHRLVWLKISAGPLKVSSFRWKMLRSKPLRLLQFFLADTWSRQVKYKVKKTGLGFPNIS